MAETLLPQIIDVPACPRLVVEPLYMLKPLSDYDSEYAVYVSIGKHFVFDRELDYKDKYEDDPVMFLKTVISDGSLAVQQMIRQAYCDKMPLKIGNLDLAYGEWSQLLKPPPFYRAKTTARIMELSPQNEEQDRMTQHRSCHP